MAIFAFFAFSRSVWKWALNEEKTRGAGAITEVCQPEMGPKGSGAGKKAIWTLIATGNSQK